MDSEQPPYTLGHDRDEWQEIKKHLANRPYLVLGLDPGISSCGFCLIDFNNHLILEMGSHLFKAPQQDKNNVSLAVVRRNARSTRRNNRRTAARLSHCLALLKEAGLVPNDVDKAWLQTHKGDKPVTKLRAVGLDRPLSDREFAQVLYSLCGKRGYIPHGEGRAGKTQGRGREQHPPLYQLGNWKAGKTRGHPGRHVDRLYQLGNWKADEETRALLPPLTHIWWPA